MLTCKTKRTALKAARRALTLLRQSQALQSQARESQARESQAWESQQGNFPVERPCNTHRAGVCRFADGWPQADDTVDGGDRNRS